MKSRWLLLLVAPCIGACSAAEPVATGRSAIASPDGSPVPPSVGELIVKVQPGLQDVKNVVCHGVYLGNGLALTAAHCFDTHLEHLDPSLVTGISF